MTKDASPKSDALRALREAKFARLPAVKAPTVKAAAKRKPKKAE
jgi:hypothetical protein